MTLRMYGSMAFAICALVYLSLLLLMYINKKKVGGIQTKVFSALLAAAIFLSLSECGYVYGLSVLKTDPKLTEITCRIYTFGILLIINFCFTEPSPLESIISLLLRDSFSWL